MSGTDLLRLREEERDRLLDRLVASLERDERVVAAWLSGSLGRGTADAWSDVDVWVVVADAEAANVIEALPAFVAAVAHPVLVLEAPANAPPGGGYLLALYQGETGAHQIDWYWVPRSTARVPAGARVLFDRLGLLPEPAAAPFAEGERAAALTHAGADFWIAVLLAGKAVARRRPWAATRMIGWAAAALAEVEWLVAHDGPASHDDLKATGHEGRWAFPGLAPETQLAVLLRVAAAMAALAPDVAALGGETAPDGARQVSTFLDSVGDSLAPGLPSDGIGEA
ncbi:MAG: hypothetical protein AVDCRST_MAG19-4424 [uncultured Thermomicrobiales bacterium]|uniref:Polymerase nucleotidyl transferase domain-containing protein n=1 Tax=uncultured Thermomicrobiales bacterium TaxID=1645740 RepID=A0A6J4VQD9_9BACT|nr:MAG: hypothetical protein AVDCRST_MAG19-4424 [uncultured Thermomicrobiales bacterium]